jgi:hypothetical protein
VKRAVFFLSTGRCGTQWLAKHLGATYSDLATVEHEPLFEDYRSRELLVRADLAGARSESRIRAHADHIDEILGDRTYVECGWPCWGALPFLAERLAGRVSIVHLTRHPVPTACSWVANGMYRSSMIPDLHPERVPVSPFDPGVSLPEYREIWELLDPFQRSLYFWAEVHRFGLSCETSLGVPWLRVRYEDVLSPDGLAPLLRFLELPLRPAMFDATTMLEDSVHSLTDIWWDVSSAPRLPGLAALAAVFGYDIADADEGALRRRYLAW